MSHKQVLFHSAARIALENTVSVASVLLLTEATLTEMPEPGPKMDAAAGLE